MENEEEEERVEGLVEPQELLAMLKELYQNFNKVLKECNDGEKASAIMKMNLLNGVFDEYVSKYNENHKISIEMFSEELDKHEDIPQVQDFKWKMGEIEGIIGETKKLMDTHSPVTKVKKGKKGRGRIRRIFGK